MAYRKYYYGKKLLDKSNSDYLLLLAGGLGLLLCSVGLFFASFEKTNFFQPEQFLFSYLSLASLFMMILVVVFILSSLKKIRTYNNMTACLVSGQDISLVREKISQLSDSNLIDLLILGEGNNNIVDEIVLEQLELRGMTGDASVTRNEILEYVCDSNIENDETKIIVNKFFVCVFSGWKFEENFIVFKTTINKIYVKRKIGVYDLFGSDRIVIDCQRKARSRTLPRGFLTDKTSEILSICKKHGYNVVV